MSRKRTAPEDIREPEHYFNRYIAMEVKHDQVRKADIEDREISLDERFEEVARTGALNAEGGGDVAEKTACEGGGLNWIEYLDTPALYDIVNALTARQKRILTMFAMQELTTREIATRVGVSQSVVRDAIKAIKRKFEKSLKAHTQKP